jgi:hypothetical protein
MQSIRRWMLPLALGALALAGRAQDVGSRLPASVVELKDYTGIPVTSYAELAGRAVLFEFFAYW